MLHDDSVVLVVLDSFCACTIVSCVSVDRVGVLQRKSRNGTWVTEPEQAAGFKSLSLACNIGHKKQESILQSPTMKTKEIAT